MQIKTTIDGQRATIEIVGKLTVQTAPILNDTLVKLDESISDLVIDLSGVEFVASAGLRVLVTADKMATKRGGSLVLLHPVNEVVEVFKMTGLSEIFDIEQ